MVSGANVLGIGVTNSADVAATLAGCSDASTLLAILGGADACDYETVLAGAALRTKKCSPVATWLANNPTKRPQ